MKTLTLFLLCGLLATTSQFAIAQPALSDEQVAQLEQRIAEAQTRLNLSEEQKTQIRPILQAGAEARRQVLDKHGVEPGTARSGNSERMGLRKMRALRADMQALREETRGELSTILTDAQLAEWQVMQEEQSAEFRKRIQARR